MVELVDVDDSGWACLCGNLAEKDGFFPVGEDGNILENPSNEDFAKGPYICDLCGRIFDPRTGRVIGRNTTEPDYAKAELEARPDYFAGKDD